MIATYLTRLRRIAILPLLVIACASCGGHANRPAAPETAAPAPAPAVAPAEDRGQQKAGETVSPENDQSAFSNVEKGETERAASQRGHQSAGEPTPAAQPGSGG